MSQVTSLKSRLGDKCVLAPAHIKTESRFSSTLAKQMADNGEYTDADG